MAEVGVASAGQSGYELEWRLGCANHQIAQRLPDDRHDAELRVVQVALHRQFDGDGALAVLEQGDRQPNRQIHGIRTVDLLAKLQLLPNDLVFCVKTPLLNPVMQIQIETALDNPCTGQS